MKWYHKYIPHIYILLILVIATLGCVEQTNAKADNDRFTQLAVEQISHGEYLQVYHDNINNVTIYIWEETAGYGYSGMSAIPDWQLEEPKGE